MVAATGLFHPYALGMASGVGAGIMMITGHDPIQSYTALVNGALGKPRAVGNTSEQFLDQIDRLAQTLEQAQAVLNEAVDRMYAQR